jgi:hypothetical protein
MVSDAFDHLELRREPLGGSYWLNGVLLSNGDPLEVYTNVGWVRGVFFWQGGSYLPCVASGAQRESEVFVILSSSVCRRPQVEVGSADVISTNRHG